MGRGEKGWEAVGRGGKGEGGRGGKGWEAVGRGGKGEGGKGWEGVGRGGKGGKGRGLNNEIAVLYLDFWRGAGTSYARRQGDWGPKPAP